MRDVKKANRKLKYRRILLKLSGEVLGNRETGECIDPEKLAFMAARVKKIHSLGVEVGIVLGGGNIFRGLTGAGKGVNRVTGDSMGMLATIINALAMMNALESIGVPTRVMTAIEMPKLAEPFIQRRALRHFEKGRVVIFGGGTGNPYFSTDSAAALKASEIGADALLKATKVDGIYTGPPRSTARSSTRRLSRSGSRSWTRPPLRFAWTTTFQSSCLTSSTPRRLRASCAGRR